MKQPLYDLDERRLEYAAGVIRLAEHLPRTRVSSLVAAQLLRSGMAALPRHGKAQVGQSNSGLNRLLNETEELIKIFAASVRTVRRKNSASAVDR